MNKRWTSSKHATYNCAYHLIWCSKYRKKVLVDDIEIRLKELLNEKTKEHEWIIENMEVMPDHVHIFIKVFPVDAPTYVVSQLKGYTSFILRNEFPNLKSCTIKGLGCGWATKQELFSRQQAKCCCRCHNLQPAAAV
jgi:putative transposase